MKILLADEFSAEGKGMNICLFTSPFLPRLGGMEVVVDRLARQFQAKGHQVLVLTKMLRTSEKLEIPKFPYEVVYYPRSRSNVWLLGPARKALLVEHNRRRFDIVHAHQAYSTGYIAVKAGLSMNLPVVVTSHGGNVVPNSRYRRRFITRRRMCWVLRHAHAVVGVSVELKRIVDELTGGVARSLAIPNGVDLPEDSSPPVPFALTALAGKPFMLTLGRLHADKALDVLLKAMAILRSRGAYFPHLVIAGYGKDRAALEQQAKALALADFVTFAGVVFGSEKDWLLRNCIFFLQPSRVEGMPLTVLEAMSYGKAVIGTTISGTVELIRDGVNGLMVQPGDFVALARAIEDLARRASLADLEAGARAAAEKVTWNSIADRYIELYQSCIEQATE